MVTRHGQTFAGLMAHAAMHARQTGTPLCPLHGERIEHGGELYAVETLEDGGFDTMSGRGRYVLTVTRCATGHSVRFGKVWDSQRVTKSGTVRRTCSGPSGRFGDWAGLVAAHVACAAERLSDAGRVAA